MDKIKIEEVFKGNKLIAEFMGYEYHSDRNLFISTTNKKEWPIYGVNYDSSWDWIMPVVEKITKIDDGKFSVDISSVGQWACFIKRDDVFDNEISSYGGFEPTILNVWKAVIQFIQFYNTQTKQQ